ncbi:NAD(P)-dependent dehydrogenase (short-subunit alcohol dehydrogenase family) [Bradyrhizobium sp. USDA 4472]
MHERDGRPALFAAGNVAVITGAASGIGRAAAERFATLGMRQVLSCSIRTRLSWCASRAAFMPRSGT